jgi:hypothetical protein
MITAYYWLEQVSEFFTTVVKDQSKATRTPVSVSVYGSFISKGIVKVPFGFIDDSSYLPLEDMFKMYRVADQEGLPFGMNPGVVAHEFQHRVFHDLVFQSKAKEGYLAWKKLSATDSGLKYTKARLLLRATDEGLSDIAAVGFSANPNFLVDEHRDLNGEFAGAATYDNLADSTIDGRFADSCNGESLNYGNPTWRYYCLGTVIAKTIWEAVDHNVDVLRDQVLPVLNQSLQPLSGMLFEKFEKYDLDVFWRLVHQRLPKALQPKLCAQIKVRFHSLYDGIKECG